MNLEAVVLEGLAVARLAVADVGAKLLALRHHTVSSQWHHIVALWLEETQLLILRELLASINILLNAVVPQLGQLPRRHHPAPRMAPVASIAGGTLLLLSTGLLCITRL